MLGPKDRALIGAFAVMTAMGCTPESNVTALHAEIAVAPDVIEFGDQAVLYSVDGETYITNSGRIDLEVSLTLFDDEGVFELLESEAMVPPDETWVLPVRFLPETYLDYEGIVQISTNDQETPVVEISLTGTGVPAPTPDIEVDPLSIDFGTTSSAVTEFVTIVNAGDDDLHLGTVTQTGSGSFVLTTDPSGTTILGGDEYPVLVTYVPSHDKGDSGSLFIPSDDPDEPEIEVVMLGNGGGDFAYPVAEIDCPNETDPPVFVPLDGSGSHDPLGHEPLEYKWDLVELADGSQGFLDGDTSSSTALWADVAGDYEVQLTVTNTLGIVSAPARCEIAAIPQDAIHVELTWNTPNADMDLHLALNDALFFETPGDCSYCNPNPDWGGSGTEDDPSLDLDDESGYGPENINIPEPTAGTYFARVHYFNGHGDDEVTATAKVYVNGVLAVEESMVMNFDEVWDVAFINWPAATAVPEETDPYIAPTRGCF